MREIPQKLVINNISELNSYIGNKYEVEFNNAVIKCPFVLHKSTLKKITFKNVVFQYTVLFRDCTNLNVLTFNQVIFRFQLGIIGSKIREKFHITNAQFDEDLTFSRVCCGELYLEKIRMENSFHIINMCCFGLTIFRDIETTEFKLLDVKAKQQVDISELTVSESGYIIANTRTNLSFTNSIFKGNLKLLVTANKEIHLHDLRVGNVFNFFNSRAKYLWLSNLIIEGASFLNNNTFENASREACRFFKNELLKLNNSIDALKYYEMEMNAYENELKDRKWYNENRILLSLNRVSNKYGISWKRGVLFTLIVGALFFLPNIFLLKDSYWSCGWNSWSDFWKVAGITTELYMKAMYAAHSFDYLKEYNPRGITFVFDMIGRIFVAYGYYQTVSAFRKFSKK